MRRPWSVMLALAGLASLAGISTAARAARPAGVPGEIERLLETLDARNAYTNVPTLILRASEAGQEGFDVLVRFTRSRSPLKRRAAAAALGHCGARAEQPLLALMTGGHDLETRAAAAISLGLLGSRASVPLLLDVLAAVPRGAGRRGRALRLRENAAMSLAAVGSPEAVPELLRLAREDREMRSAAVLALAGLASRWSPRDIAPLAASRERPLRRAAAALLGGSRERPSAVAILRRLVRDDSSEVRLAAALSLGVLGGSEAERALRGARDDRNPKVDEAVEEALACVGPPVAVPPRWRHQPAPPPLRKTLQDWFALLSRPIVAARMPGVPRRGASLGLPRTGARVPGTGSGTANRSPAAAPPPPPPSPGPVPAPGPMPRARGRVRPPPPPHPPPPPGGGRGGRPGWRPARGPGAAAGRGPGPGARRRGHRRRGEHRLPARRGDPRCRYGRRARGP